ncbi:MAG: DNA starvation/stationary phase protection protein [Alphaproteobacteria bacterium]|nr:DNA starvation/stationary phase protection protein [Alphaproteobacteria bacterium]
MKSEIISISSREQSHATADCFQHVLADTYALYLTTHHYHWNVEGSKFVQLHKLFDEQYNELFKSIDYIAERIRALDHYALPFAGDRISKISGMISEETVKDTSADQRADKMVHNLITLHRRVIESCQTAKEQSRIAKDDESESLMTDRITAHQQSIWMLRSIIK